ncbi:MAG: tRNA (adenosine(37)-N6)-threonylcarbamoyltransferase complex dimerization subunit type 1 TsaB [Woeseiaceae bacterium]|nr:tRNA (adenosine(37)-N6)-threonylcarbamoyltransferase complex dimerization subunit type 1 TsaB [Woeseiaceae bacterium]
MKLLALDTSSDACTVAVMNDGEIIERHEEQPREHTRILLPMIRSVLDEAGMDITDVDAIALGNGPGSFIGMRIAASVAQGLAHGAGVEIVPVSSLAIVAALAGAPGDTVAVTQDAHMQQVYLGIYRIDDKGYPEAVVAERLHDQVAIPELAASGTVRPAGCGWERYPALAAANRDYLAGDVEVRYPRAGMLATLAEQAASAGAAIAPDAVNPAYLRQKVAEKPAGA